MTEEQHEAALRRIEELIEHPISRELNQLVQQTHAHEKRFSTPEPEQETCGSLTHYAGCACHEQGWQNKWQTAIDMAARAQIELDEARRLAVGHRDAAKNAGIYCPYHTWLLPWESSH